MKAACSLEMVNLTTSGPGVFTRQSKKFWVDYIQFVASVGFTGIELPFNCYNADPMAFETGRSGIPCNRTAIDVKYGGSEAFHAFLNETGITDGVADVHVSAQDAMLELLAAGKTPDTLYGLVKNLFKKGLEHTEYLGAGLLVLSASPELGWLYRLFGEDLKDFEKQTTEILSALVKEAEGKGIKVAAKDDFWGYFRKENMQKLLNAVPGLLYCPDPANLYIEDERADEAVHAASGKIACARLNDTVFIDTFENWKKINAELPTEGPQKVYSDCGDGKVDLKAYLDALKDTGFDGWIICENKKTLDVYKGLLKLGYYVQHTVA